MYHAYTSPYSVLPQLQPLGSDPIFEITPDRDRYLAAKEDIATRRQVSFEAVGMTADIYDTVCRFIVDRYPAPLAPPHTFDNLARQIQEDLVIQRLSESDDWLGAAHVSFPSGWDPAEKIGRPLSVIHAPVPGMNLAASRKLVETMVHRGPYQRYVWSAVYEDTLDFHPGTPKKPFDPAAPVLFIKVERQITYGFADLGAALFVLRQHMIPEAEIDKRALHRTLMGMSAEHREYKGVTEGLIGYVGQ